MKSRSALIALAVIAQLLASGCGMFGGGSRAPRQAPPQPPVEFTNRVWRVAQSTGVPVGTLYVFLSDNTMLITPPAATTPVLGRWHSAAGGLVLIEEGFRFPADIVELGQERFVIRVHREGSSVDIAMVPARDLTPPAPSSSSPAVP